MKNNSFKGHFRFEMLMFFRNFVTAFFLLIFPTMMLLIFGSIYGNEPNELYGGAGSVDMFVPAYSGIVIAVTGLMNIPMSIAEYRERGIFKRYRATTSKPQSVIFAQLIINAVMTFVGMCILVLVGKLFYHIELSNNILQCLIVFAASVFCIFSIGFFVGGIAPGMKAAGSLAYLIFFPMLFLSGATLPYEIFPDAVQKVAKCLPLTHTVSAMKSLWNGGSLLDNLVEIIVILGSGIVFLFLSRITFRWEQ